MDRTTVMRLDDSKRVTVSPSLFADLGTSRTVLFVGASLRPTQFPHERVGTQLNLENRRSSCSPILVICVVLGALMGIATGTFWRPAPNCLSGRQCGVRPGDRSSSRCRPHLCLPRHRMWTARVGIHRGQWRSGGVELPIVAVIGGVIGSVIAWRIGLVLAETIALERVRQTSAQLGRRGVAFEGPLSPDSTRCAWDVVAGQRHRAVGLSSGDEPQRLEAS